MVREHAGAGFADRAENIILLGPPGVGKTHLAIAFGVKAAEAGHRVLFQSLEQLMNKLKKAQLENRLEKQLQHLSYPKVLIIDEVGYLPLTRDEAILFFRLITRRYEKASTILTSIKSFVDWGVNCRYPFRRDKNHDGNRSGSQKLFQSLYHYSSG